MKPQNLIILSSGIVSLLTLVGMFLLQRYDLELFFSVWIMGVVMSVMMFSSDDVPPACVRRLNLLIIIGLLIFAVIVVFHALRFLSIYAP